MKFLGNLYTLLEIAIHNNFASKDLYKLASLMYAKKVDKIQENFPILIKFIPYCKWYFINGKNVLAMSAYIYDLYINTGMLPDLENYDMDSDIDKLEHWQYINPYVFEINPNNGFEFAKEIFPDCDIWNLFLAGNSRMNYYQEEKITIEDRIKYAIVEYMLKRPQFFNTNDFVENPVLKQKYKKKEE